MSVGPSKFMASDFQRRVNDSSPNERLMYSSISLLSTDSKLPVWGAVLSEDPRLCEPFPLVSSSSRNTGS